MTWDSSYISLKDSTSPAHTRSSAHPCVWGSACEPFEKANKGFAVNPPKSEYINFTGVSGPQDFFTRVRDYTLDNYYSQRTLFSGNGGPCPNGPTSPPCFADSNYFYAPCLAASEDFGILGCPQGNPIGRKIAQKGWRYLITQDPKKKRVSMRLLLTSNSMNSLQWP